MRLFGTDGVRGAANEGLMTPTSLVRLAQAAAFHFVPGRSRHDDHRFTVVIGKDTRLSGYMVEASLMAGFVAMGCDVVLLGPVPTPAVAILTPSLRAHLGVMISASHNPSMDNGIKFFNADGKKLSLEQEYAIEHVYMQDRAPTAKGADIGRAKRLDDALGRYIECVKATFPKGLRLNGMKIVVDAANGAMYKAAPTVLWELGAEVMTIGCEPNGLNINEECGATSPQTLAKRVVEEKADLGIALDGDGDRVVLVDETGSIICGDYIIALLATMWQKEGRLHDGGVVGTILSNMGLEKYCHDHGIAFHRAPVGDRFVHDLMTTHKACMGGEPSGHIVLKDFCTTGDGMMAALQVLSFLVQESRGGGKSSKMSFLKDLFRKMPQVNINVPLTPAMSCDLAVMAPFIHDAEQELEKTHGRLVVRPSGTEPLLRLMAEGEDESELHRVVEELAKRLTSALVAA